MSSTNRGALRQEHDYYVTPVPMIVQFLQRWIRDEPEVGRLRSGAVLDPCAGGNGTEIEWLFKEAKGDKPAVVYRVPPTAMSYPEALRAVFGDLPSIVTMDVREDSLADVKADFLSVDAAAVRAEMRVGLVITNPPFSIAREVIEQALSIVADGGYVVMLLRLAFLGSQGRREFFRARKPRRLYVHTERPSFLPDGTTDSADYAHFVWQRPRAGEAPHAGPVLTEFI